MLAWDNVMTGDNAREFVDYYALLNVDPASDAKTLEKAYRHHAQLYHPDHSDTSDVEKFQAVNEAYGVLRNPEKRAKYDQLHASIVKATTQTQSRDTGTRVDSKSTEQDADFRHLLLYHLYKRRRASAGDAGVIAYVIRERLGCDEEAFDFHVWYLKSKGFIEVTEQGTLAITVEGVDHVIAMTRGEEAEKLLLSQMKDIED